MAVFTEMDFGSILSDAELDSDVDNSDFDLNGGASSWIPKVSGVLTNFILYLDVCGDLTEPHESTVQERNHIVKAV